jgi:2-dehydropantoate 2-reductase
MKITIIGAGAVGSVLGALLSREHEVTLVGRSDHVKAINKNGLQIEGEGTFKLDAVTDTSSLPIQDFVIITVKAYDLERAVQDSKRLIGPGTLLLIVQNGLMVLGGPLRVSFAKVCIGVAYMGATVVGPGKVKLANKTKMTIGCMNGRLAQATRMAQLFNKVGMRSEVTDDIIGAAWMKTLVNASINPVTAITMEPNGSILADPRTHALSKKLFEEGLSVAKYWDILTDDDICYSDVEDVIRSTADNRSSMLQDLERGRRTEIDAINGAICEMSAEPSMVKANVRMVEIVKALETWRTKDER